MPSESDQRDEEEEPQTEEEDEEEEEENEEEEPVMQRTPSAEARMERTLLATRIHNAEADFRKALELVSLNNVICAYGQKET